MFYEHDNFSRRLWQWLESYGFTDDPFALYVAEQERSALPYFFVDRPYLYDILGDPARPQTAFLLAERGHGKTATREMVAYECTHAKLRRHALPVHYYDFDLLLQESGGDLAKLNARHHLKAIARATFKTLANDVPPTYFDLLDQPERRLLMSYAVAFADPLSQAKLAQIISAEPLQLNLAALSPLETLQTLANLVMQLGLSTEARYQALYILVDRVDETALGPQAAVPILKPLVSQGPLLETGGVAFKFFLPKEVGEQLRQVVTLRPDRLALHLITWDQAGLRRMIEQRLTHYSEGRVARLEELCAPTAKKTAMDRLIQASEGSPRNLLRLGQSLIFHHVTRTRDALLDGIDITTAINDFKQQLEVERDQLLPVATSGRLVTGPATHPEQGLFMDASGHVWVDGEALTPPLSELEFRLLRVLYQQSPDIVSRETLIQAVWPSSAWDSKKDKSGMDEQNLRKLITRLRQHLEGEAGGQPSRFIQNARSRGYWLKTR
jgi:hypothetical protein